MAIGLAVALTGGSDSPTASGSGSPGPSAASQNASSKVGALAPILKPQLLTVADLPSGWSVDNSTDNSSGGTPACLKDFKSRLHPDAKAEADFVQGSNVPALSQQIAYYAHSSIAFQKFATATETLDSCKDVSYEDNGQKITGAMGAMSFPKVGQASRAWRLTLTSQGVTIGFDVVLVQQGSEIEQVLYGDLGTPDLDEFTTLVKTAIAKMPQQ